MWASIRAVILPASLVVALYIASLRDAPFTVTLNLRPDALLATLKVCFCVDAVTLEIVLGRLVMLVAANQLRRRRLSRQACFHFAGEIVAAGVFFPACGVV